MQGGYEISPQRTVRGSGNFIPCRRRTFKQILGLPGGQSQNLKGRSRANRRKARFRRMAPRRPHQIRNIFPGSPEKDVISMERGPGFQGAGWKGSRGLPCAPGRSPRAAAFEVQGVSRESRSLLCDAHCWAPRDIACALRMCGTFVYYGITSHSMSMCMLAHENVDGALHCLHACVCMAYVYVRVLAWCTVHCVYDCTNSCMFVRLYA